VNKNRLKPVKSPSPGAAPRRLHMTAMARLHPKKEGGGRAEPEGGPLFGLTESGPPLRGGGQKKLPEGVSRYTLKRKNPNPGKQEPK